MGGGNYRRMRELAYHRISRPRVVQRKYPSQNRTPRAGSVERWCYRTRAVSKRWASPDEFNWRWFWWRRGEVRGGDEIEEQGVRVRWQKMKRVGELEPPQGSIEAPCCIKRKTKMAHSFTFTRCHHGTNTLHQFRPHVRWSRKARIPHWKMLRCKLSEIQLKSQLQSFF